MGHGSSVNRKKIRKKEKRSEKDILSFIMKFVALIHEGRKVHKSEPFLCPDCDYKTKDSSNIKRHIQTIHEGIAICCKQCEFKTPRKDKLKLHMKLVHEGIQFSCS